MSTRSKIAIATTSGDKTIYRSIYCHNDGYPEGVGETLKVYYTTRKKIERLIAGGSISSLEKPKKDRLNLFKRILTTRQDEAKQDAYTEQASSLKELRAQARHCWAEYLYIWNDKRGWKCEKVRW